MLHLTRKDLVRRDHLHGLEAVGGTCSSCWRSNTHHCSIGPFVTEADIRGILQSSEVVMTVHCPSDSSVRSQVLGFHIDRKGGEDSVKALGLVRLLDSDHAVCTGARQS